MDMRKLLEAVAKFAGEPEQKPGDQVRGTDLAKPRKDGKHPFAGKLVGAAESKEPSSLKGLSKIAEEKGLEWQLAEEYAKFNEDDLGVEPKRPHRKGTRAEKVGLRGHKEQPRYKQKEIKEGIESDDPVENAVLSAVQELIQQGHTEVAPEVITNMVVASTSQPFLLKDLVDVNNNSQAVQHYIDSINPTKVKFSSEILTVKNEDPAKDKKAAQAGVSNMAARAAGRNRLGEASTPLLDKEDYQAKSKALQDIQMDPSTGQDPQLSAELVRRKAELIQQAKEMGISESRAHKLIANKLKQMELQRQLGTPQDDEAHAKHVERMQAQQKEYVKSNPNTIYKRELDEYGADQPTGTAGTSSMAAVVDPKKVAQVQQATNTLKAATGSTAPTTSIAKALDSASQGKAVGQQDMKALEPVMKDIATIAQDPKLAGQYKSLAGQVNQSQLAQAQQVKK